ncbi:MAG: hypothetical protein QM820_25065 [Minicystis sp.]
MIIPRRLASMAIMTAALGCAEARSPAAVDVATVVDRAPAAADPAPAAGAPAATFRVLNHLAWPFRLARVSIGADGAVVKHQVFGAEGEVPATIAVTIPVAPGEHVFQLLAAARVKLTAAGPECTATLRSTTPFVADEGEPAEVSADLYLRDATRSFEERLDVRTRLHGARSDPWIGRRLPAADEARCRALRAPERAVCRVEALIAAATRERDVIKLVCNRDKLDQMRVLARMRDEAREHAEAARSTSGSRAPRRSPPILWMDVPQEIEGAGPMLDEAEYQDRVIVLERQIEALGREAEQCIGEDLAYHGGPTVTVDECFATGAPEIDFDLRDPRMPDFGLPAPMPWNR